MKGALISVLLAACAAMGCLSVPSWWEKPKPAPPPTTAKPAPPRPVTAEQITDSNARQMANALVNEMDRDTQTESAARSSNSSNPR